MRAQGGQGCRGLAPATAIFRYSKGQAGRCSGARMFQAGRNSEGNSSTCPHAGPDLLPADPDYQVVFLACKKLLLSSPPRPVLSSPARSSGPPPPLGGLQATGPGASPSPRAGELVKLARRTGRTPIPSARGRTCSGNHRAKERASQRLRKRRADWQPQGLHWGWLRSKRGPRRVGFSVPALTDQISTSCPTGP